MPLQPQDPKAVSVMPETDAAVTEITQVTVRRRDSPLTDRNGAWRSRRAVLRTGHGLGGATIPPDDADDHQSAQH